MRHTRHLLSTTLTSLIVLATCIVLSSSAQAAYKLGDDTNYLKIGGLLQAWGTMSQDKAPDGDSMETEFYLRRMRLMFYGQLTEFVNFFIETDNPNFGKGGDMSMNTFIQDAYLELNFHKMIQLDMGMLLVPFSHHGMQGATSLLGLDYHSALIKYPAGSTKVWRDYGVMLRGIFFGKWLEYRLGVFNGVHGNSKNVTRPEGAELSWLEDQDPRNDRDFPRLTGRLTLNILEPEGGPGVGGMFYDGIYIKKTDEGIVSTKKVLSVGGSVDWQKDLNVTWEAAPAAVAEPADERDVKSRDDYVAAAADVFWDIPIGAKKIMSINGQINFYYYNYGDRSDANAWYNTSGDTKSYTGYGISSELGFRYDAFQPVILFDFFDSTKAATDELGDYMGIYGGFNYWLLGHSTAFKIQFGANKINDADDWVMAGSLQAQLIF